MKRPFIYDDFLLGNKAARDLFHRYAKDQPIIDFHNHLSPEQIANNHQFGDLQEIWLAGDHYKWRAMRANGISEREITGPATAEEKFQAWAWTAPYTLRNPLYHWTHLELTRYFGITDRLNLESAPAVWREANAKLPQLRVHDILKRHDVRVLCTTDDPADPLDHHQTIRESALATRVCPTYRPDKALQIHDPKVFGAWLDKLAEVAKEPIFTLDDLLHALKRRHDDFHEVGCRASDHGLTSSFAVPFSYSEVLGNLSAGTARGMCAPATK